MTATQMQDTSVEEPYLRHFGESWIRAITEGALNRLEEFCQPKITGRLLIPAGLVSITSIADLIAEYRGWFGECSVFKVETCRVAQVGGKLGISYQFLLQEDGEWYRIEQHLFCVLKDSRVQALYLLCSGFQPVGAEERPGRAHAPQAGMQHPHQ